jgi:hypothetical protein
VTKVLRQSEGVAVGLKSRRKGKRGEREIVALAKQHGLHAERTWSTAQASDPCERACDVRIEGRAAQVRIRANGFGPVYDALEGVEMAFLRADRREWLAALRAEDFLALLAEVLDMRNALVTEAYELGRLEASLRHSGQSEIADLVASSRALDCRLAHQDFTRETRGCSPSPV